MSGTPPARRSPDERGGADHTLAPDGGSPLRLAQGLRALWPSNVSLSRGGTAPPGLSAGLSTTSHKDQFLPRFSRLVERVALQGCPRPAAARCVCCAKKESQKRSDKGRRSCVVSGGARVGGAGADESKGQGSRQPVTVPAVLDTMQRQGWVYLLGPVPGGRAEVARGRRRRATNQKQKEHVALPRSKSRATCRYRQLAGFWLEAHACRLQGQTNTAEICAPLRTPRRQQVSTTVIGGQRKALQAHTVHFLLPSIPTASAWLITSRPRLAHCATRGKEDLHLAYCALSITTNQHHHHPVPTAEPSTTRGEQPPTLERETEPGVRPRLPFRSLLTCGAPRGRCQQPAPTKCVSHH